MSKQSGIKKYQIDMFVGTSSFIFRTDALKEVKDFTGIKKFNSESVKEYLARLSIIEAPAKKVKGFNYETEASGNDYIAQVKKRLSDMGVKSEKEALKILKQKADIELSSIKKLNQTQAQYALVKLYGGK